MIWGVAGALKEKIPPQNGVWRKRYAVEPRGKAFPLFILQYLIFYKYGQNLFWK